MKILGIGNAIVDVICKVDDKFIQQNNLTKSTMKLFFNENEFQNLLSCFAKFMTSSKFFASINEIISCSLAKVTSSLFLTKFKK